MKELYESNFSDLSSGIEEGYTSGYDLQDATMNLQLQNNIAVFAAFKSYRETSEMKVSLTTPSGEKKPWNEFLKESKAIDKKYRSQWLKAEYDLAVRQGRSAENWMQFERDKETYPNLEYIPSSSAEPRLDHRKYYGLILPIDDSFWDTGLPPLEWGCKCSTRQSRKDPTAKTMSDPKPIKGVAGNAGKLGMVFTPNHPYVSGLSKELKGSIRNQMLELRKSFDKSYFTVQGKKGKLDISFNADIEDLQSNFHSAKLVVDNSSGSFKILPHHQGQKNPEYYYKGATGDKTVAASKNLRSYVDNTFKNKLSKDGQLSNVDNAFVMLDFNEKLSADNVVGTTAKIYGRVKRYDKLKFIILQNGSNIVQITKKGFSFDNILSKMQKDLL